MSTATIVDVWIEDQTGPFLMQVDGNQVIARLRTEANNRLFGALGREDQFWFCYHDKTDRIPLNLKISQLENVSFDTPLHIVKHDEQSRKRGFQALELRHSARISPPLVVIWDQMEKRNRNVLLKVPCQQKVGKQWRRVELFLKLACGSFDSSNYDLMRVDGPAIDVSDPSTILSPGDYCVVPKTGNSVLSVVYKAIPIFPRGRLLTGSTAQSVSASSTPSEHKRHSEFVSLVNRRDGRCLMTGHWKHVDASHIIAHAWWHPLRRPELPVPIKEFIQRLDLEIDSVQNGLLLRKDLAEAFDHGEISFDFRNNKYFVVAISPVYERYDDRELKENVQDVDFGDGESPLWAHEFRPHPDLVEFHLRNSVLNDMIVSGFVDEEFPQDEDAQMIWSERSKLIDTFDVYDARRPLACM